MLTPIALIARVLDGLHGHLAERRASSLHGIRFVHAGLDGRQGVRDRDAEIRFEVDAARREAGSECERIRDAAVWLDVIALFGEHQRG